nr:hypothetical protein [Streptomyces ficellus]
MSSDQQYPYGPGYPSPDADPDVAQTWEGQTWDTQYQPAVQHGYQQPQEYQPQGYEPQGYEAQGYEAQGGGPVAAAETAHLPVRDATGHGSYPLPPEVPYDAAPYDPPTTHLRPVAPAPEPPAPPAAPAAGPGYGAPTTSGHVRLTDAQRARAEGRSPIIDPGMQPAVLTAALGGLLAAGAALGPYALLVPLVLLQAVTAAGWFRLNGMWPARQGIALAFAGGLTADAVLLAVGKEHAPAAMLGTLGVWVLLVLVLQLRSHAGSDERQYGLMATVASSALAVVAAGHLAAASDAVIVGGLAVAVTVVARALPLPGAVSLVVALLAAAGAGVAAGGMTGVGAQGALLGLGAGVCALVGHRVAAYDYPSKFVHMTAGVALPLAVAAPAVYVLGRALT